MLLMRRFSRGSAENVAGVLMLLQVTSVVSFHILAVAKLLDELIYN